MAEQAENSRPPKRIMSGEDRRMELTEHLGELRARIIRSLLYLVIGAIVAYQFYTPLYGLLYRPFSTEIVRLQTARTHEARATSKTATPQQIPHAAGPPTEEAYNKLVDQVNLLIQNPGGMLQNTIGTAYTNPWEPFTVRLKLSIIFGFIFVMPLIVTELMGFLWPAFTPSERRPFRILTPISIILLVFGVLTAYYTLFYAMRWFLSFLRDTPGAGLINEPQQYVLFVLKMMAAFGVAFQLPVVLMGLGFAGLITASGLLKNWRWGIVIAVLGGLFTPSNDLVSMALMSIPLLLLYFLSVLLVLGVERMKARDRAKAAARDSG